MKIFSIRLLIALVTFTIGIFSPLLWFYYSHEPSVKIDEIRTIISCEFPDYVEHQVLETDKEFWNEEILGRFKEQPLENTRDSIDEAYRFILIPTFDAPVSIRVWCFNNQHFLTFKKLSGEGGFGIEKFGKLNAETTLEISENEWFKFISLLHQSEFWSEPSLANEKPVNDGAEWIMEGFKQVKGFGKKCHEVRRITPSKEFRASCNYLLKLTGFKRQYEDY